MKRIVAVAAILLLTMAGVAVAAETVAPTLADVYKAVMELKADVAQLKADGFTKANSSGQLATAKTTDGLVVLEVTSLMAGPDATVVGVKVTNSTKEAEVLFSDMNTTLVAGGKELAVKLTLESGKVLPGTSKQFVLLAGPMGKDVKEVTLRTRVIDTKSYKTLMEPTLAIVVK